MTSLLRVSGAALFVGGFLGTAAVAVHPADIADPSSLPVHLALYTAVVLAALGLPGLYAVQAERSGVLGIVGLVALFVGLLFGDPIHSILAFTAVPVLAADPGTHALLDGPPPGLMGPLMIAIPVLLVGLLITAITSLRARVLPAWPSYVAIAAVVLIPIGFALSGPDGDSPLSKLGPALLYLSLGAFGYVLAVGRPALASAREGSAIERQREHAAASR